MNSTDSEQLQNQTDTVESGTERIEPLYRRMAGAFIYKGNGDWSKIKDVVKFEDGAEFQTRSMSYESVPHNLREQAYDSYNGKKTVIVGCNLQPDTEQNEVSDS